MTDITFRDEEGFDEVEVVVAGRNSVKVGGRGERAEKLFLHYAQRSDPPRILFSDLNLSFNPPCLLLKGGPKTICGVD